MEPIDGVVKYRLDFRAAPPLAIDHLVALIGWRRRLYELALIGQTPERYLGIGFGNVSGRVPGGPDAAGARRFAVSGTQTGLFAHLNENHFAVVTAYRPLENELAAEGPIRPSSEAMTHGMIYDLDPAARFVFHVHSPDMWRRAAHLSIPETDKAAPYGTPAMAREVRRLHESGALAGRIFAMGGHEDGIVSWGESGDEAGERLVAAFRSATAP